MLSFALQPVFLSAHECHSFLFNVFLILIQRLFFFEQ